MRNEFFIERYAHERHQAHLDEAEHGRRLRPHNAALRQPRSYARSPVGPHVWRAVAIVLVVAALTCGSAFALAAAAERLGTRGAYTGSARLSDIARADASEKSSLLTGGASAFLSRAADRWYDEGETPSRLVTTARR